MTNQNYTILLIDDEKLILEMYALKLEEAGYHVLAASGAQAGLQLAEQHHPDLVFVDIVMPERDGFWLLEKIKKHTDPQIAATPVIMLTNLDDSETRKRCTEGGCLYFLVKPLHIPSELVKLVADIRAVKEEAAHIAIEST